ncbi:sugar transferase [Candidatus Gottesmanbacteria bacterium]|nr:sugar transferase [Candidatus Gottesmanbacteria bacterium]MBI5452569.1 sugar transferase [Candidatus Gottesmanbacteria bacterium]
MNCFNGEKYDKTIKRYIDILGSSVLLIIFSPLCLLLSLAIKLDSSGPVFADTPERIGKGGKLFKMLKFRSMIENAHQMLRRDPRMKSLYEQYKKNSYKLKEDPRVTTLGRFIRKHSFDEIPQLVNVLKGEMSLVGPRAYYPDELSNQQKKYPDTRELVKKVLSIKPGITGYWQVSGRSEVNFDKRIAMDADYVDNRSLWYDIKILIKTPFAMISGKGAV